MIMKRNSIDMVQLNKDGIQSNQGFTLVEMIVTMVVLGIVLSLSVMGILSWQDWSDLNRENEYAETLFLAAQNQLSEYNSSGTLSQFSQTAYVESVDNKVVVNQIYYENGKAYTEQLGYPNSVWTSKEAGTICYLKANKGDYSKYIKKQETSSKTAPVLFDMISSYIYDTSILDYAICIEFSLEDGQVFSAFFNDKQVDEFVYNHALENQKGQVDISKRYETYRNERMIGYYGVSTLSKAKRTKKVKVQITDLVLQNEDTLNLKFNVKDGKTVYKKFSYKIEVYDNDSRNKMLELVFDATSDGDSLKSFAQRDAVPFSVTRFQYDDTNHLVSTQDLGKKNLIAYLGDDVNNPEIHIVLDAVDLQATSNRYKTDSTALANADDVKADTVAMANTFSFHRFGIDSENIYCEVSASSSTYQNIDPQPSNSESVYFANTKVEEEGDATNKAFKHEYEIANARHLYNIRYVEDNRDFTVQKKSGVLLSYGSDYTFKANEGGRETQFRILNHTGKTVKDWKFYFTYEGTITLSTSTHKLTSLGNHRYCVEGPDIIGLSSVMNFHFDNTAKYSMDQFKNKELYGMVVEKNSSTPTPSTPPAVVQKADSYIYLLTKNIDWIQFVKDGNYYDSKVLIKDLDKNVASKVTYDSSHVATNLRLLSSGQFASIGKLNMNAQFMTDKNASDNYTISGLMLSKSFNAISGLYVSAIAGAKVEEPVGLFNYNYGNICNVNLDSIQVNSNGDKTGAFAGTNIVGYLADDTQVGTLSNLCVMNSARDTKAGEHPANSRESIIIGASHVGGIVGYLQGLGDSESTTSQTVEIKELQNHAKVIGETFVGGIAGELRTTKLQTSDLVVEDCMNTGAILALGNNIDANGNITIEKVNEPTKAKFLGGITGLCRNIGGEEKEDKGQIIIRNCNSNPVYSEPDLNALLDDGDEDDIVKSLGERLNGIYVGGIVGYNQYGDIRACGKSSKKNTASYVFGYQYVGGIIGYNQGKSNGVKDATDNDDFEIKKEERSINGAHVIGHDYVGGIIGCNADIDDDSKQSFAKIDEDNNFIVKPTRNAYYKNTVEEWENKGSVLAIGSYAGDVTGYNTGWIYSCDDEVDTDTLDHNLKNAEFESDYVGGIAGYNNGIIGRTVRRFNAAETTFEVKDSKPAEDKLYEYKGIVSGRRIYRI